MQRAIIATLAAAAALVSTMAHGQDAQTYRPTVPLMLPASDSFLQSFVRLINKSNEAGEVSITAVDDGGNVYDAVTIQLAAGQGYHFNSGDLTDGNANKGIGDGIGAPMQGNWRLSVETNLDVEVLSYTRARDGFLTATHEVLPESGDGYLVKIFNPASNTTQQSRLRVINWGSDTETVRIDGVDDGGNRAGPVSLTLPAGHSRILTAVDLEEGAHELDGTLGDGMGKWRLNIRADVDSVAAQSLLYASSGHVSNLSAEGFAATENVDRGGDDHGGDRATATIIGIDGDRSGRIDPVGDVDWFRISVPAPGWLTINVTDRKCGEIEGGVRVFYDFYNIAIGRLHRGLANCTYTFPVTESTYYVLVDGSAGTGNYVLHVEYEPEPANCERGSCVGAVVWQDDGGPLVGGITWGHSSVRIAEHTADVRCGEERCAWPTHSRHERTDIWFGGDSVDSQCVAVARGYDRSLISTPRNGAGSRRATLAEAQERALRLCEGNRWEDCELWEGMAACADGSHLD